MVKEVEILQFDKRKKIWIPQPTRFWILGKELHKAISQLEEKGFINLLEEKITDNDELFEEMVYLHEKEIKKRREILKKKYSHLSNTKGFKVLLDTNIGIGGIRNFREKPFKLKCLHLWTAYHLGDTQFRNYIGEEVLRRIAYNVHS